MFNRENPSFINNQNVSFLFSFLFAVTLPLLQLSSSLFSIAFNILFFPFTLIHELGHYIIAVLFFPKQNPQIHFHTFKEGLTCGCVTIGGIENSWGSILLLVSGSLAVILTIILSTLIIRRTSKTTTLYVQKFFLFGLLFDLPNLFPTYPTEGIVTDGFRMWLVLHDIINLPYPTYQFSLLFTAIATVITFYSIFYLGCFLYQILTIPVVKLHKPTEYPTVV